MGAAQNHRAGAGELGRALDVAEWPPGMGAWPVGCYPAVRQQFAVRAACIACPVRKMPAASSRLPCTSLSRFSWATPC